MPLRSSTPAVATTSGTCGADTGLAWICRCHPHHFSGLIPNPGLSRAYLGLSIPKSVKSHIPQPETLVQSGQLLLAAGLASECDLLPIPPSNPQEGNRTSTEQPSIEAFGLRSLKNVAQLLT